MKSFLPIFDVEWFPLLRARSHTMRRAVELLEETEPPYNIIETGCMREPPSDMSVGSDGSSTLLWDRLVQHHGGGVSSCELNPDAITLAAEHCSPRTQFLQGDSVSSLMTLRETAHLIYLDSHDLEWHNPHPSALHHLAEMASASRLIHPGTLVLVDDCGPDGGKGLYVNNWLHRAGARLMLRGYQMLWRFE
jgi:hypothetical protein